MEGKGGKKKERDEDGGGSPSLSIVPGIGPDDNPLRKSNLLARKRDASVESRNFPRGMCPRKRKLAALSLSATSRHRQPLSLFPQLAEFLGRISRAGTRPTSRLDEKGHHGRRGGKFGNCLSAGYPQTVLRVSRGSGINGDNAS